MNSILLWLLSTELGRRAEMQILMNLVTSSLRLPTVSLLCMPSGKALEVFASFTAKHLQQCSDERQQTLSNNAFRLGTMLRRCLTDRSDDALTQLVFLLYRNIGIEMNGQLPGKVCVCRCHFITHYSPHICSLASLMDSGVVCGVFGGGKFTFSERMTEGKEMCCCELRLEVND